MTDSMWSTPADDQFLVDPDCSPTKTCKNMVGVSFDGFDEHETDTATAWRKRLELEGKLSQGSVADLILGTRTT